MLEVFKTIIHDQLKFMKFAHYLNHVLNNNGQENILLKNSLKPFQICH